MSFFRLSLPIMQVAASYYHKMGEKHNSLKHTLVWAKPYIPLDKHTETSEISIVATRAFSFDMFGTEVVLKNK